MRLRLTVSFMKFALAPLLPWLSFASLLLASCTTGTGTGGGGGKPATAESLAALENADLSCVRLISKGTPVTLPSDAGVTLRITGPGKVAGRAAVNRYFGGYTLAGPGNIKWTPFGSTRMAGPPERMTLENEFLATLPETTRVETTARGLLFQSADGKNLAEFTR